MAPAPPPVRGRVVLSSPVRAALAAGHPVVALESTIIAHGLPYPDNLACARALEAAVRSAGAIPATVAVLAGVPHAGLTDTQLTALAAPDAKVAKLALRDIPRAVAGRLDGATTVSATMHIASQAGIAVFATGGVGGVHRGPLDVSQDLLALSRIPVLVVSAGVKSVLDVRSTLEALEAMSVPVFVWRAERFPAFYARDSGLPAPAVMGGAVEVAGVWQAARRTSAARGMLLAVPPADQDAAAAARVEKATQRALKECEERSVAGADVTPFLLRRIAELSGGDSVRANVALAVNNARVAGEVAVEIARMSKGNALRQPISANASSAKVIVAGVAALDVICTPRDQLVSGTSTPGRVVRSLGGVACNVARAAARSGARVELLAAVGDDADGRIVRELLASARVSTRSVAVVQGGRTPTYCAMHDGTGDLQAAVADMDGIAGDAHILSTARKLLEEPGQSARVLAVDANLAPETARALCLLAQEAGVVSWLEPTSVPKATRVAGSGILLCVDIVSPNSAELSALAGAVRPGIQNEGEAACAQELLRAGVGYIILTQGEKGAALYRAGREVFEVPALKVAVRNTSGAGDALAGAMIAHVARRGLSEHSLREALRIGVAAAAKVCSEDASSFTSPGIESHRHARL